MGATYLGRFAPSPTGPLHAGSLVAALASWLDARAHGGRWLVRIEDVDTPRCVPGAAETILQQLAACSLIPDEPPLWQSQRGAIYQQALDRLVKDGHAYPCACSRKDIELALAAQGRAHERHGELVYPGTCRNGLGGRPARAWRFRARDEAVDSARPQARAAAAERGARGRRLRAQARGRPVGLPARRRGRRRPAGHHADRARRGPRRQHRPPDPPAAGARPTDAALPAHAAGAGRQWRKAFQAERRAAAGLAASRCARSMPPRTRWAWRSSRASVAEALASWQAQWRDSYNLPRD